MQDEPPVYPRPVVFWQALSALQKIIGGLSSQPNPKRLLKIIIDRSSGSRRSRVGYELFLALQKQAKALGLAKVRYVRINLDELATLDIADFFTLLLAHCSVDTVQAEVPEDYQELVAASVLGLRGSERGLLLVHIEEFQENPAMTEQIFHQLQAYYRTAPAGSVPVAKKALVVPVFTGQYSADVLRTIPRGHKARDLQFTLL